MKADTIDPKDLSFRCTSCGFRTKRSVHDLRILLRGRLITIPPSLVEAPCIVCAVVWPHFVDLNRERLAADGDPE